MVIFSILARRRIVLLSEKFAWQQNTHLPENCEQAEKQCVNETEKTRHKGGTERKHFKILEAD